MRTRDKWRDNDRGRSLEEHATALAYICWQIALDRARNLHGEDFDYQSDRQRTTVIAEYLHFLVHVSDRLVHGQIADSSRQAFVGVLGRGVARHFQRNLEDVYGHGKDYATPFIDDLNARCAQYAADRFADGEPGFSMLRGLGRHIQDVMGEDQTNRWVIDHVMQIDGPAAVLELKKSVDNLFGTAAVLGGVEAPD